MILVTEAVEALSPAQLTLYCAADGQLCTPVLIFHGSSTTTNSTRNSSRIQLHVLTTAGFQSYTRLTVAPNSRFYAAVDHLPRENQGDEVCRGMAFGLLKYFHELPQALKTYLLQQASLSRSGRSPGTKPVPELFTEVHVADLVKSMVKVENCSDIIRDIQRAFQAQSISHIDADLVLPPGSIKAPEDVSMDDEELEDEDPEDPVLRQYGEYAPLVKLFGQVAFLPTSRLRRAPSRPTSLNRTKAFAKEQKISLRREMGELVDTEERYVIKMHELVNQIADDFRDSAKKMPSTSLSPSPEELEKLFPQSLDCILKVNSSFMAAIRKVMDETEEEAMQDLESDATKYEQVGSKSGNNGKRSDPTGALAFAKVLLEWFPQFSECYQEYIRASQDFPKIISRFTNQQSSFSHRLQQTGEQKLRSAVIEPVQRLPRYTLFIDNIVNYLPISHPALQPLLKARDFITAICSLDPPVTDKSQSVKRLRNIVEAWPQSLRPQGRLISATDFVELQAPYDTPATSESISSRHGILLLFSSCVVILRKVNENGLSARGVVAEVDKPSASAMMGPVTAAAGGHKHVYDLAFAGWYRLVDIRLTQSNEGSVLWMMANHELRDAKSRDREANAAAGAVRAFILGGSYEDKVTKWTEEVTKARIEGRFSEKERESEKWSLRNINLKDPGLNLYTAIFEEGIDTLIEGRKDPAPVRIVVDYEKGTKGAPVGHYGIDIVANVKFTNKSDIASYRLQVDGLNGVTHLNDADAATFMPLFSKRLSDLLQAQYGPGHPTLTASFVSFYMKVLKSLNLRLEGEKPKSWGSVRPTSPVKMISNFLSANTSFGTNSSNNTKLQKASSFNNVPSMPPPPSSSISRPGSSPELRPFGSNSSMQTERPVNQLVRLEETCTGYIAAIQARKGNVVGKVLRNRIAADELSVNDLYNSFIENPYNSHHKADEASVDVLFMAFEKFLNLAWREQMGSVLSLEMLKGLLDMAEKLFPGDFEDYVRTAFGEMAPQNRRAFIALVKLLADLLDGCGNDGDRGALTITFAELLVPLEANPHDFVNLLDRMVEDCDKLFDDTHSVVGGSGTVTPSGIGSFSSRGGTSRSANTGSLTSNASSLRRKLGFDTLLRQNSKPNADPEQKTSMWGRSRSKSRPQTPGDSAPNSLSKDSSGHGSLHRSKSTERGNSRYDGGGGSMWGAMSPRRPQSRERPTVIGAFDTNERPPSSGSGHLLSTIGASPPPDSDVVGGTAKPKKKKRRSSLSDLKDLMSTFTLEEEDSLNITGANSATGGSLTAGSSRISRFNSVTEGVTPGPSKPHPRPLPSPLTAARRKQADAQQPPPKQLDFASHTLPRLSSPGKKRGSLREVRSGSPILSPKLASSPKKENGPLRAQNSALSSPGGPTLRRREGSIASISPERHSPFGSLSKKSAGLRDIAIGGLTERNLNVLSETATVQAGSGSDIVAVRDLWSDPAKAPVTPVKSYPIRTHSKTISLSQIPTLRGSNGIAREISPLAESIDRRERRGSQPAAVSNPGSSLTDTREKAELVTSDPPLENNASASLPLPKKGMEEARKGSMRSSHLPKIPVSSHSLARYRTIPSPRRTLQRDAPSTSVSSSRLRLQSPTKLRDRNFDDEKAINALAVSLKDEIEKIGKDMSNLTLPAAGDPKKVGIPFGSINFQQKHASSGATGDAQLLKPGEATPPMLSPSLMPPIYPFRKSPARRARHSTPPAPSLAGSPYPAPLSPAKRPSLVSPGSSFPPPSPSSFGQKYPTNLPSSQLAISSLASDIAPEVIAQLSAMQHRIRDLESRIPKLISNLTSKNEEVKRDLSNLLETEQYRVKELDQLYREATAENELLYERFGTEIGKIVRAVKTKESKENLGDARSTSKDGTDRKSVLLEKIEEGMKEMAAVRNDNARLKREVLGLKTLLKGNGIRYNSNRNGSGSGGMRSRESSGSGLGDSVGSSVGRPDSSHSPNVRPVP